ncbi:MAG: c-type cytochrome [Bizionia sp.]|nr:c-type cytochrome [Bizionia sp.]
MISIILMEWVYETDKQWAMLSEPIYWIIIGTVLLFGMAFEICIEALRVILFKTLKPEQQLSYLAKDAHRKENQFKWFRETYKKMLGSKAIEEEKEIILDHDYDGIRELDNNLPPWWVYSFYATIIFAIVYMVRFEVLNDYSQDEEYEMAVAEAKIEIAEWKKTAKDLVDVNTVILLTEASDLSAGKKIYETNCIACHKSDGGGGIGPNLTDAHWILGGGVKNVFKTISEGGRAGKGMIPWKSELKPLEIAQVSSYVIGLGGTMPAEPKAAEGDIWQDENAPKVVPSTTKELENTDEAQTEMEVSGVNE